MIKRHGRFILSLGIVVGIALFFAYIGLDSQGPEQAPQIEPTLKTLEFKPPIVIPEPLTQQVETEKTVTEEKKAPEVKEAKAEIKKETAMKYKAEEKREGKGFGGNDKKGFPSFSCDMPVDEREFLYSLQRLGVKEFVVLRNGKVSGIVAFDSKYLRFENRPPSSSGGFQRVLSDEEAKALGIYELEGIYSADTIGFYLSAIEVKKALNKYLTRHSMNIEPEILNGFACKYGRAGIEVTEVYNN